MVNNFNNFGKFGNGVYYIMRTCHIHTFSDCCHASVQLFCRQFSGFLLGESHFVAAQNHTDSPYTGIHTFFDIGYRIPVFYYALNGRYGQINPCSGKSCRVADVLPEDCWKSHSCLWYSHGRRHRAAQCPSWQ